MYRKKIQVIKDSKKSNKVTKKKGSSITKEQLQRNLKNNEQDPVTIKGYHGRKVRTMKATTTENHPQSLFQKHGVEETIVSFSRCASTVLSKFFRSGNATSKDGYQYK